MHIFTRTHKHTTTECGPSFCEHGVRRRTCRTCATAATGAETGASPVIADVPISSENSTGDIAWQMGDASENPNLVKSDVQSRQSQPLVMEPDTPAVSRDAEGGAQAKHDHFQNFQMPRQLGQPLTPDWYNLGHASGMNYIPGLSAHATSNMAHQTSSASQHMLLSSYIDNHTLYNQLDMHSEYHPQMQHDRSSSAMMTFPSMYGGTDLATAMYAAPQWPNLNVMLPPSLTTMPLSLPLASAFTSGIPGSNLSLGTGFPSLGVSGGGDGGGGGGDGSIGGVRFREGHVVQTYQSGLNQGISPYTSLGTLSSQWPYYSTTM